MDDCHKCVTETQMSERLAPTAGHSLPHLKTGIKAVVEAKEPPDKLDKQTQDKLFRDISAVAWQCHNRESTLACDGIQR